MSWVGRYEDRLESISSTLEDVVKLDKMLNYLSSNTTLKNAVKVAQFASQIHSTIGMIEAGIETDFRAHWITSDEYETLINKLIHTKYLLTVLGWEEYL